MGHCTIKISNTPTSLFGKYLHILTQHVLDNIILLGVTSGEAWEVLAATPILLTIDSAGDDDDEEEELSENFSKPTLRTVAPEITIFVTIINTKRSKTYPHPSMFLQSLQNHHF